METEKRDEKMQEVETIQLEGLEKVDLELEMKDLVEFFYESFASRAIHIESVELEMDTDRYVYEIEGWDDEYRYELTVNAKDLRIIAQEKKENFKERAILDLAEVIDPKEAMTTALAASGGGKVEEWELEKDLDRMVYTVDLLDGSDQEIDALTGELIQEDEESQKEEG